MGAQSAKAHLFRYVGPGQAVFSTTNVDPGKILKDDETVGSYNIEEKGYVVCMVNKVRCALSICAESRV
jgi:hypothetical protein